MPRPKRQVLVGTGSGLYQFGVTRQIPLDRLGGRALTALVEDGRGWIAIVEGELIWAVTGGADAWQELARVPGAACLAPARGGLLVGTAGAHLFRLDEGEPARVESFEHAEGRREWYTPWGGAPDVRSMSVDAEGVVYVNVHVGGILRSADDTRTWRPTIDLETDVHQVLAHPARPALVLAATAVGLALSDDRGETWRIETGGLHARYLRAVAASEDRVLVSASRGPGGGRAAVYRKRLDKDEPFERCRAGLPEWLDGNVDTGWLGAAGSTVAFGTRDGAVFRSDDTGDSWEEVARGLQPIRCVAVD
jgi:hypothetical protein